MAVTRGTLQIARRLRRDIGVEVDAAVRTLTTEWVNAWDGLASTWRAAADELVTTAVRLERWPYPVEIMRLGDVDRAVRGSITALDKLAERTDTIAAEGADRVSQLDVEREARIVASQAPAAEEPGLARTLANRLGRQQVEALREAWALREQDARTDVRLTVQSRIRTDAVDVIAQRTSQQIHSDTIPLSPQAVDSMRRELIRGIDVGSNPREAAARMVAGVQGQFNGGLSRAMVISRTEMLDAYRTTSQQIHAANADVVPGWEWLAEFDTRVCPSCLSLHGTRYPVSEPGPQDHQQGRCARLPVLTSWAELGISAPEPPSVMPSAEEWFARLPRAKQLQIMGPARLQLLDDGLIGWGDLATLRQSTRWRPSYVPTPVRDLRNRTTRGLPPTPRPTARPAPAPQPAKVSLGTTRLPLPPGSPRLDTIHVGPATRPAVVAEMTDQARLTPKSQHRLKGVHDKGDFGPTGAGAGSLAYYWMAGEHAGHLHLHPDWGDPTAVDFHAGVRQSQNPTTQWFTPTGRSDPMRSTLAHEYGHHLHAVMRYATRGELSRVGVEVAESLGLPVDMRTAVIRDWTDLTLTLDRAIGQARSQVEQLVSRYGATSATEMFAEVWQEYSTLGAAARPHIRAIGFIMREVAEAAAGRAP